MARKCSISGKARQTGNRVSHAKNRRKHVFSANLHTRRFFLPSEDKYVKLKVSTRMMRTIDKLGIEATLKKYKVDVKELLA